MKQSKFTTILPITNDFAEVIIHNTFTNALTAFTYEKYELYKEVLEGKNKNISKEFIDQLVERGFIVEDDFDEMKNYEFYHQSSRFNSANLFLTIAPSLDCQFACPYCYELGIDRSKRMNQDTQDAILQYIRDKKPRNLNITWYGGEPLMQMDIIENLTERILKYCEENVVNYQAGMITNGYLMDEAILNRMLHCKITNAQVTIDGPKEIHDSRRYLVNKGATYDIIMDNIENALGRLNLNVRVNVDKTNMDQINQLALEMAERNFIDSVHVNIGHVTSTATYDNNNCISRKQYAELEDAWYEQLSHYSKTGKYSLLYHYPNPINIRCMAETKNAYVIDPDGLLYKCWNHIGKEHLSTGSIHEEPKNNSSLLIKYMMSQDIYNRECVDCKFLPYCGGGCLDEYIRFGVQKCHPRKYNYENYIIHLAEELLQTKLK